MFTAWLPNLRKLFYLLFSTKIKICSGGQMLQYLILRTRLCGTGFINQHGCVVHFRLTKMVRRKCFVPVRYQLPRGISEGLALKYFCMIHRGGRKSVIPHTGLGYVTHMKVSCYKYEWVLSHLKISPITHMNESCHTYEWATSHMWL